MRYLSVCSGIAADAVAWHPMGWETVAFSETDRYASAVLAHHYPEIPNHGDFTTITGDQYGAIDLIVGGTPCQTFSVAGKRAGLDEARGVLSLEFCRLVDRVRPKWFVWENVPGVKSSGNGLDFGTILKAMAQCGYSVSYRILDAQYVRTQRFSRAVPQRRKRLFAVGHLGEDWRPPAAVLFDPEGLRRSPPPSRQAGEKAAPTVTSNLGTGGFNNPDFTYAVTSKWAKGTGGPSGDECQNLVMHTVNTRQSPAVTEDIAQPLDTRANSLAVSFSQVVRRITPLEAERLQGFPDYYTLVPWRRSGGMSNSSRIRMIGNAMAVNVIEWIGRRIQMFESLT